jgi:hypothetical protein
VGEEAEERIQNVLQHRTHQLESEDGGKKGEGGNESEEKQWAARNDELKKMGHE